MNLRNAVLVLAAVLSTAGCKTKADLKREQDLERLKQEVSTVRGSKADTEMENEELRGELSRMNALLSERTQYQEKQFEQLRSDLTAAQTRIQALEQKIVAEELASVKAKTETRPRETAKESGFEMGKKAYDDGDFEMAIELLRPVAKGKPQNEESKKAQYYLAESYFGSKDFATAAIEFGEFKKHYAKDPLVPTAIYRQANAFKNLSKSKEAKLFYTELIDGYPKHPLVAKAKAEVKKLK